MQKPKIKSRRDVWRLVLLKSLNLRTSFLLLFLFYGAYLTKSALGINVSDKYAMPSIFKVPFMAMDCVLPIEGNYCYISKQKVSLSEK